MRVREGGPDLLHQGCHEVVGLKVLGLELLATLRAADWPLGSPPVAADAGFAEVVHAGQHDGVPEEVAADGAGQVFSHAASGRRGSGHGQALQAGDNCSPVATTEKDDQMKRSFEEDEFKQ